ncbi:hypothetical protein HYE68_007818 [Fusarium pseudograminearum]|nr:hypothetical protein FPSE5266_08706 [Fusarium pseudograminearum]QPC77066.1 hypothetical protein HYE68_007818 [Fusarium pseudograminearum]
MAPAPNVPAKLEAVTSAPTIEFLQRRNQVLQRREDEPYEFLRVVGTNIFCLGFVICVALGPAYLIYRKNKKKMVPASQQQDDEDTGMAMRILQL